MEKKLKFTIIAVLLCCVALVLLYKSITAEAVSPLWNGAVASAFAGGTGTETDPYLISDGAQLAYFSQRVNSGITYAGQYIKLTQDILLNEMNQDGTFVSGNPKMFTSIGKSNKSFQGHFDGDGKAIIGLYINKDGWNHSWIGLFGYAAGGSEIKNVSVSGSVKGGIYTGAVAGYTNGVIAGCAVNAKVTAVQSHNGGITGYADTGSTITNCTVSSTVQGRHYAGGIAGYTDGVITGCAVNTSVNASENYGGGIAGYGAVNSEISGCTVSGTVEGRNYAGGVAGWTDAGITDCTVNGTVTASNEYAGGIAGCAAGAANEITNCSVSGTVRGRELVGGVAGKTYQNITDCTVDGMFEASNDYVGGIAGYAAGQSIVSDCSAAGNVTGHSNVGGVAGRIDATVTGCSSGCTVTGSEKSIGGVVGYAGTGSEVSNSSSSGNVSGRAQVGGVAGYAGTGSEVSSSSSSGDVSGKTETGGVVGFTDGLVSVCINDGGTVTGVDDCIGGIAGKAGSNNTVSNCFNSGAVSGNNMIGGIVGSGDWSADGSAIHNNLSIGEVTCSSWGKMGGIVGYAQSDLTPAHAWHNYYYNAYNNAPGGTDEGDVDIDDMDGAVPIGDMTWEEVIEHLNDNNPAGDDVWSEDENGIPVPGIFVPHDAVEILRANIKEGRHYTAAPLGTGTSAAVTADSVFTAAFSVRYNETYHLETQTIGLANEGTAVPLPANTSIIMLVDGVYYYKNLATELGTRLALGEFIKMGSATENYAPAEPVPAGTEKEYLFIFDFSQTAPGIAPGAYKVELLTAAGTSAGAMPSVTVSGVNTYSLTASGENGSVHINLSRTPVEGYDYKTDGKSYACELQLEQGGVTVPFPIGAKINGAAVTSILPYAFTAAAFGDNNVSIDMSGCAAPLAPGSYDLRMKAYACTAAATPRDGYLLAGGGTTLAVAAPGQYAIRARAAARVFDKSAAAVPVVFNIETLGSGAVKSTLQRKYGASYVNMAGQTDLPVAVTGGGATLTVPAGCENGTYRFVLTLYDNNAAPRAQSSESVIIK